MTGDFVGDGNRHYVVEHSNEPWRLRPYGFSEDWEHGIELTRVAIGSLIVTVRPMVPDDNCWQ